MRRPVLAYQQLNNSSHGMGAMTFRPPRRREEQETAVEKRGRRRRRRGSESTSARACRRTRRRRRERPSKQGARPCRVEVRKAGRPLSGPAPPSLALYRALFRRSARRSDPNRLVATCNLQLAMHHSSETCPDPQAQRGDRPTR